MTPETFRRLALELPEAVEREHMGHPDFRVGGRIFASLSGGPDGQERGMVKLDLDDQEELIEAWPDVFAPCAGAWGRQGCTAVVLGPARVAIVRDSLRRAWRSAAATAQQAGPGARKTRRRK